MQNATLKQLQQLLNTEQRVIDSVMCKDGTTLSVQASEDHYCHPQRDYGPYTEVEVWRIESQSEVTEFDYTENDPSAYVEIEAVVAFIDKCGGLVI